VYDSANQLIRENNQKLGKTWTWSYDSAGNILSKSEYAYTTGELGTPIDTVTYTYGDSDWGDLLTGYDGKTVTSDEIGNMLSDGVHNYTWEHGRQLASMDSWDFEYDTDGLRTRRYDSETGTAYTYRYSDGLLRQMIISSGEVSGSFTFRYDNTGKPVSFSYDLTDEENAVNYSGEAFYVVNVQGDVIELISDEMDSIGSYTYDAWGVVKSVQVYDDAFELVVNLNPLRYRGYVYDHETGLYYLQSRYYNPEMGRFINADGYVSTGRGFLGYNMFAYCGNNPVNRKDATGQCWGLVLAAVFIYLIVSSSNSSSPETPPTEPQKNYNDFLDALGERESSNDYSAENQYGYLGRYQMGSLALQDAGFKNASGEWTATANAQGVYSKDDFLNSPQAQDAAITAYHEKVCGYIRYYELDQYIGSSYQGVVVTHSGLLAACHLVGIGAMCTALATGEIAVDANGVSAHEYMSLFGGYDLTGVW